jgi:hypothetical protein
MGEESRSGMAFDGRPIAWAHTGDGIFPYRATVDGVELLLRVNDFPAEPLYSLLVNGQVTEDLEDWPARWVRPGTPPHLLRAAGAAQVRRGRIDAIVAAAWASELCLLSRSQAAAVVAVLGLPGTLDGWTGSWHLTPPPPGTTRFAISERNDDVDTVRVTLGPSGPTRADLNAILGPGGDVVRVHYDQPYPVCYRVTAPEAPYTCDVFAYFATQPAPETTAESLMFRRQRQR